jgi:glycosyltransferase involved in cell wall biosynthesis
VSRPIRVAIDVRPLARGPATGIGLLVTQIVEELTPRGFEFVGVSDRPLPAESPAPPLDVRVSGGGGTVRWEWRELPRLLRSLNPPPDLFHATWNHGVPPGLPFPSVLSLHDLIPWVAPRYVPWPWPSILHRRLYRDAVRASARRAAAIVTLSEASRRDIGARVPEAYAKVEVVPCAVPRWFHPADPRACDAWRTRFGGSYLLYFGGFDPRKGLDLLVEGMARAFADPGRAPTIVLAGAVSRAALELQRAATRRGLRLLLPGYVPDPDLAALLGGATLFVYPSRYEGFGIPPLLAMAAGTPCVVSDAPAIREVVGDAGLFFPSGDATALGALLAVAVQDPSLLDPLAARGRERAARFSVQALAQRMIRVYERAASSPARSA